MKILTILLFFIGGSFLYAQQLSNEFYKELLDKELTKVLTGQNTNFGSYAGIGIKEDIASFAGNIQLGTSSNLNINVRGGVTEGIIALLDGEKVSSSISVNAQVNFGLYKNFPHVIEMDATEEKNYKIYVDNLGFETEKLKEDLKLGNAKVNLELLQKKEKLESLKKTLNTFPFDGSLRHSIKRDSIKLQIKITDNEIIYLNNKLSLMTNDNIAAQSQALDEKEESLNKEAKDKLSLYSFTLDWFSVFGNIRNRSFNEFMEANNYDQQIYKRNNNRIELGVAYNIYKVKNEGFGNYFLSLGLSYSLDDNFEDLVKKTLNEKQDLGGSPAGRSLSDVKTVYIGDYQSNISQLKTNTNFYWFPSPLRSIALHLQPTLRYNFKDNAKIDGILGLLFGFKNSEKDKSILNIELFYNMKDIFKKSSSSDDQLTDRSTLGINLNFPITFKTISS